MVLRPASCDACERCYSRTPRGGRICCEEFCAGREERSTTPDGGPLACRVVHRAKVWKGGETPQLERTRLKGQVAAGDLTNSEDRIS
jgi:hypothetical protein